MDVTIKMPDLATADSEVTIIRWLVEVGQPVKLGQPLLEIETDKASMEVESVAAGTLRAVHVVAGERVEVGYVIATIESAVNTTTSDTVSAPRVQPAPSIVQTTAPTVSAPVASSRVSLFARNKAARGQIAAIQSMPAGANQREVARRMLYSKQTVPHFYLTTSANAEPMAALRAESARCTPPEKIAWDAFFVRAVARALQAFDRMKYRLDGDTLIRRPTEAIGVAVDLDDALYVVAVENPLMGGLAQLSGQIAEKVARIRRNEPGAKTTSETCLTVTNLGAENVETFLAIVNPPESAILAIGKVAPAVVAVEDQVVVQKRVSLSLSVDHRVVNGKYAAKFLSRIVSELEAL